MADALRHAACELLRDDKVGGLKCPFTKSLDSLDLQRFSIRIPLSGSSGARAKLRRLSFFPSSILWPACLFNCAEAVALNWES